MTRWIPFFDRTLHQIVSFVIWTSQQCVSLFRNDDDWSLYVHLNIDGLMCLQRMFKSGSGLISETFERLTRHVLCVQSVRWHERRPVTYHECINGLHMGLRGLEEIVDSLDVTFVINDLHRT